MAPQLGRVAGPSPPGRGPQGGVPETASSLLALHLHGNGHHSQARSSFGYSGGWLSNFSHVRKSPSCEEFEDLLSKLPFPGLLKKGGKRQHHLSFPFFFPCPWESSKHLWSSCVYFCSCWGGSRWGVGSGLQFSQWASGSILRPETALQGWTDVPAFLRGELCSTRLNNLSKPTGLSRRDRDES